MVVAGNHDTRTKRIQSRKLTCVMIENMLKCFAAFQFQRILFRAVMSLSCPKKNTLTRTPES